MAFQPRLIVQLTRDGRVDRQLSAEPPASVTSGDVLVEHGPTDADGRLEAPAAGEVVLSLPSPEALRRDAEEIRRVIAHAGTGAEPLLVDVEAGEELREEELAPLLDAARHTSRAVILRIVGDA
jgi:hypothetical protein